nr:glycine-rich protein 1-like [Aegilops tauschii subsp. strangulata]
MAFGFSSSAERGSGRGQRRRRMARRCGVVAVAVLGAWDGAVERAGEHGEARKRASRGRGFAVVEDQQQRWLDGCGRAPPEAVAQRAILARALTGAGAQPDWAYAQIDTGAPATGAARPAAGGGSGKATAGWRRGAGQQSAAEVGAGSGGRAGRAAVAFGFSSSAERGSKRGQRRRRMARRCGVVAVAVLGARDGAVERAGEHGEARKQGQGFVVVEEQQQRRLEGCGRAPPEAG